MYRLKNSIELLWQALNQTPSKAFWCRELQISRNTLAMAQIKGRLSPTIAGNLARLLGEPVQEWVAIAALEAEPNTYGRAKLQSMISTVRNL